MTIYAGIGAGFEATTDGAPPGLVGTIGVRIRRDETTVVSRTTAGITEDPGEPGRYIASLTAPSIIDRYSVVFDTGGPDPVFAEEELIVGALSQWPPDVDMVRSGSSILTDAFPSPAGDADLQLRMIEAAAYVSSVTARAIFFPSGGETAFGCSYEDVPPELQPLALRAIRMALEIESVAAESRADVIEQREGGLASFSAGPYSESYFQPGSSSSQGLSPELAMNGDPALSRALWGLLTPCARTYWLNTLDPTRPQAPAASLESYDWFPESHLYPPGGSAFSPDGW
jgi:hypothetical protein